jgi:hypothetical protein
MPKPQYFDAKTPSSMANPFRNKQEENAYQAWWVKGAQTGTDRNTLTRSIFDKDHGSEYSQDKFGALDLSGLKNIPQPQEQTVHIILNDPAGNVKDIKTNTGAGIRVTVTPTSGIQGKK